jgi:hypothetical protein
MPGFNEVTITTWEELNEELFKYTWNPPIKRYRSNFAYRGVNNSAYKLSNGLSRLGKPYNNMEKNLIKQFKKYANRQVTEPDSEWHWLIPILTMDDRCSPSRVAQWT